MSGWFGWGVALLFAWFIFSTMQSFGLIVKKWRVRELVASITWLSPRMRRAIIIGALAKHDARLKHKGVTIVVMSEGQVAMAENLGSYEHAVQMLQWMQRESGEDLGGRPELAWPENFAGYTGPSGDFADGQRV